MPWKGQTVICCLPYLTSNKTLWPGKGYAVLLNSIYGHTLILNFSEVLSKTPGYWLAQSQVTVQCLRRYTRVIDKPTGPTTKMKKLIATFKRPLKYLKITIRLSLIV